MTFREILVRRIGGLLCALLLALELFGYMSARRHAIANLREEGVLLAQYQAERIRTSLAYVETVSEMLTRSALHQVGDNRDQLEELVRETLDGNHHISAIEIANPESLRGTLALRRTHDGQIVEATAAFDQPDGQYRSIKDQVEGSWVIPRSDPNATHIFHLQQRDGIKVVIEMPIRLLADPLAQKDLGFSSAYGFLATGSVVLFTNTELPATNETDYSKFCAEVLQGLHDTGKFYSVLDPIRGEPAWVGTYRVGDLDLVAGVVYLEGEEVRPFARLAWASLALAVSALVLLLLALRAVARRLSKPLADLDESVNRVLESDFADRVTVPRDGSKEVRHLATSFNTVLNGLHRYLLEKEEASAAKQSLESELSIAARIQASLVPTLPADFRTVRAAGVSVQAKQVGGDFLNVFPINDDEVGFFVGDVSGKGVPAAIYMAFTASLLRYLGARVAAPKQCFELVNEALCEREEPSMFATCFFGVLDKDGTLHYCNAGHHNPILYQSGADAREISGAQDLPLGVMRQADFSTRTVRLVEGDNLLLYTDGVTEAMNRQRDEFGESRLWEVVSRFTDEGDSESHLEQLLSSVERFRDGQPANDDLTALLLHFYGTKVENGNT